MAVDELDLEHFYARYRDDGQGASAHDPKMMVGLWLYAYAIGLTSTRKIEQRLAEDVAFRVLAANQRPDHTTLNRFRADHQEALAELFGQILILCERAGLLGSGIVAIDGTKLHANASLSANRTAAQIQAEVERYFEESARVDAEEDERYGKDKRGDELPSTCATVTRGGRRSAAPRRSSSASRLRQRPSMPRCGPTTKPTSSAPANDPSAAAGEKPYRRPKTERRNLTDYDSRVVRDKGSLIQGFNAQAAVCEGQLIVAADLTNEPNDTRLLEPMASAVLERNGAEQTPTILADTGY